MEGIMRLLSTSADIMLLWTLRKKNENPKSLQSLQSRNRLYERQNAARGARTPLAVLRDRAYARYVACVYACECELMTKEFICGHIKFEN